MKTLHLTTLAVLSAAAMSASAFARPTTEANLAEMYEVVNSDPTDVPTRLRLAGYLQQLGLMEEGNAILSDLAAIGADIDLFVDDPFSIDGCPECVRGSNGPDVIVGDLNGMTYWGRVEVSPDVWVMSYSTGTTSCNIGNQQLEWFQSSNRHPVIGQTVYRIKGNVLMQLGQGWLKHGFFALSQQLCNTGCQSTNGSWLGVNCSDPYTSSRNGQQSNLGPKYQVRASSGFFNFPFAGGTGISSSLSRRVQVAQADLDPTFNAGSIYFTDGQYVQWQDSQFENDDNNSSWRRFQFSYNNNGTPNNPDDDTIGNPTFSGATQRMKTPVDAWQFYVPSVQLESITVPNDSNIQLNGTAGPTFWSGRFHAGNNVVDNGDGTWTYVYSIYNQNSDRSARSFTIPVANAVTVTNAGFNDVAYHSGDGNGNVTFDGTNWTYVRGANNVSWSTQTFAQNQNANALRWGTTYTFWFTANSGPATTMATLGLFRPGSDADPEFAVRGPACLLAWDLDDNGDVGFSDLNILLGAYGSTYTFGDLNELLGSYGQSCN